MFFDQGIAPQQIIMNFTPSVQSGAIFFVIWSKNSVAVPIPTKNSGSTSCLITEFLGKFAHFLNLKEDLIHIIHIYAASRKTPQGMESTLWSLRGIGIVSSGESLGIDRNRMEYALETTDKTWKWTSRKPT